MATLAYPAPLDAARGAAVDYNESARDITTTVLVVGGGPVGMLQALILARLHKQPCMLLEREETTTIFPKMEYTNGRSMEIYRALGLAEELRKIGTQEVPEHYDNNEVLVTSLLTGGKVVDIWPHAGAAEQREIGKKQNDGSSYLEPHMRCYQIILERWLKEKIEAEPLITSHWGTAFVGLDEKDDHVITEAKIVSSEEKLRIKSQYVIGCDGGGSWVRKSANLESKRNYLNLTVAFVHYRSAELPKIMPGPRAWHHDVIGGGVTVSQNEKDLWTTHYMCPPDLDPTTLSIDEVLGLALGGCQGLVPVPYDEIYCRGVWKVDVAIANSFRSARGRVFLAGDAAHQLSPIGGHGLNSGLGDAYDLGWKLSAVLQGWAGEKLLASYTEERRAIAFENLDHVQEGLGLIMPIFGSPQKFGAAQINADGPEGEKIREQIKQMSQEGKWLHDQNGNILGANYKQSSVIDDHAETGQRPQQTHMHYNPNTWPGNRAPHLWLTNGASTHDILDPSQFNIVDFSGGMLSQPFLEAAKVLKLPVKDIVWDAKKESNARDIYERDLVLIRPDSYVAWRGADGASYSVEQATQILRSVTGQ